MRSVDTLGSGIGVSRIEVNCEEVACMDEAAVRTVDSLSEGVRVDGEEVVWGCVCAFLKISG